jgi:colicin import membrane protein
MPAKKKGPSVRQNQQRKLQMQKIAKGGRQLSGVKKPSSGPTTADAKSWQKMNQLGSAKSAKAAEPKPRTPAPGTGNVIKSAIDRGRAVKDAAARSLAESRKAERLANRARVAGGEAKARKGAVAALAGAAAEKVLGPVARKAGGALAERVLKPAARKLDDAMPGVNSKDEARRRNAQAASKGSTSKFKGARDAAVKKASAIKGSPVVGPRKSFDESFAAARKAGKKEFTWKGKKYTTKVK